jgi:putative ABC transport system permease protein
MWLIGLFAGIAVALATVGVHGIVAYATSQRSRELGIRMALGARPSQLFSLVALGGLRLAITGAALGSLAAYGCTKLLGSLLFGVGRTDPGTYLVGAVILSTVATLATFGSALRAARTDPSITLRAE